MRETIRKALRRNGWDLHRYQPQQSPDAQLQHALRIFGIDLVLDIGANVGQYGAALRDLGYRGRLISFEPLGDAHKALVARAAGDDRWDVAPRGAIGDADGEITINIAGNSASSSVLAMLDSHRDAAPQSAYIGSEIVPIRRLDTLLPQMQRAAARIPARIPARTPAPTPARTYVKIDTQGYEQQVIDGASATLAGALAVQLEMSLTPFYAGQTDFAGMLALMAAHGFALWGFWPGFAQPGTGRILQADAIFARPEQADVNAC